MSEYLKSSRPELVDLKITDYCDAGCEFCYQGSTVLGKHADSKFIDKVRDVLCHWQVFEVAIGGGEPTDHPDFAKILQEFRNYHIVPNFTTKSLKWLDRKDTEHIIKASGNFAYSVDTPEDVIRLKAKMTEMELGYVKRPVVHYVMGSTDFKNFEKVIDAVADAYYPITLLGYKTNNRGATFKAVPYKEDVLGFFRKLKKRKNVPTISIDTKLAEQIAPTLIAEGVIDKSMVTMEDGKFSMYVDAVARKFGPSSYCEPSGMSPIPMNRGDYIDGDEILSVYRGY